MNRLLWFVAFLVTFSIARGARADELNVDVRPAAASLDAEALRRGIAAELRDTHASGTIVVDVEAKELVVTYGKLSRRVPMPADPADARKTAIALAGNLARDEAGELAAALAKKHAEAPSPEPPAPKKTAPEPFPEDPSLRAALAVHAARERRSRPVMGMTMLVLGGSSLGVGAAMFQKGANIAGAYATSGGAIVLLDGFTSYLFRSAYERLADDPNATEDDWIREAASEHSWRKVTAILDLVVGGSFLATGTFVVADPRIDATDRHVSGAFAYGFGVSGVVAGIWRLVTPGPVESGLQDWQTAVRPDVAIVPGGAVASVAISF